MCGIIGYTGSEDVKGVLLDALEPVSYTHLRAHET
mgnify:CR=1 FL=1